MQGHFSPHSVNEYLIVVAVARHIELGLNMGIYPSLIGNGPLLIAQVLFENDTRGAKHNITHTHTHTHTYTHKHTHTHTYTHTHAHTHTHTVTHTHTHTHTLTKRQTDRARDANVPNYQMLGCAHRPTTVARNVWDCG